MLDVGNKGLRGLKFIDLFCGIGGFHLALSSFGAECVFASDIDKQAINIYEKNFNIKVSGDITKINPIDIPKHDVICAGFPCQAFSISGKREGFMDKKGRGELYKYVVNIAKYHKPKYIILENVKNLESHKNGQTLKHIINSFENIGYNVFYRVLNAGDYGVPQARKRIYIICFREDLNITEFEFPHKIKQGKYLIDILTEYEKRESCMVSRKDIYINKEIKEKNTNGLLRIGKIGKGRQGERIYSIYGYSVTLSSQGGGVGGKTGMYLINNNVYKLTGRECARLMGFPDDFIIAETNNLCYHQFGNSVVVDVLQYIIKQIILKEKYK